MEKTVLDKVLAMMVDQALIDHPVLVRENDLAQYCGLSSDDVKRAIQELSDLQIIEVLGEGKFMLNSAKIDV